MSNQYKTALVLVFGIFVGISVSLTSSVLAEKQTEETVGLPLNELRNFSAKPFVNFLPVRRWRPIL